MSELAHPWALAACSRQCCTLSISPSPCGEEWTPRINLRC